MAANFVDEIVIDGEISAIRETFAGTTDFGDKKFSEVFRNKTRNITNPHDEGEGISQNAQAIREKWRLDLGVAEFYKSIREACLNDGCTINGSRGKR